VRAVAGSLILLAGSLALESCTSVSRTESPYACKRVEFRYLGTGAGEPQGETAPTFAWIAVFPVLVNGSLVRPVNEDNSALYGSGYLSLGPSYNARGTVEAKVMLYGSASAGNSTRERPTPSELAAGGYVDIPSDQSVTTVHVNFREHGSLESCPTTILRFDQKTTAISPELPHPAG